MPKNPFKQASDALDPPKKKKPAPKKGQTLAQKNAAAVSAAYKVSRSGQAGRRKI
jgi:hypothetical protein